jgi:hypothetical protein
VSYRHGMTAAEARDEGIDVAADVPDCATFEVTGFVDGSVRAEGDVVQFALTGEWRWAEATFVVDV